MPPKKYIRSNSDKTRGRSKSASRVSSRARSRTPSRSRSRSRSTIKKTWTPASESKVRKRRSPSVSSSSSEEVKVSRKALPKSRKSVPGTLKDLKSKSTSLTQETSGARFSQRLVQKFEIENEPLSRSAVVQSQSSSIAGLSTCSKIGALFRKYIYPSPVLAFICLISFLPMVLLLNLSVLPKSSLHHGYHFAGVTWPTNWRVYFDIRCLLFATLYQFVNYLLMRFIPIGYKMDLPGLQNRRYNGLFLLFFFCGLYAFIQFCPCASDWSVKPTLLLPKYHVRLVIAAGEVALLATIITHIATRHAPPSQLSRDGNTGNFIVDFWRGRTARPLWFGVDWKLLLLRSAFIGSLLCNVTYLLCQWEHFNRLSPALIALVAMISIAAIDFCVFEYTTNYSLELRYEGFGYYTITAYFVMPFVHSLAAVYLSKRPDVGQLYTATGGINLCNCALLGLSAMLFVAGCWIYRAANNQKDLFRRQPSHPSFGGLDKISGPRSQKLLAGGWWGFVRHPNYLGNLMMAYASAIPTGFASIYPWLYPLLLTGSLLHRIWRTEYLNAEKYGTLMTMYKQLVPSRLLPHIF